MHTYINIHNIIPFIYPIRLHNFICSMCHLWNHLLDHPYLHLDPVHSCNTLISVLSLLLVFPLREFALSSWLLLRILTCHHLRKTTPPTSSLSVVRSYQISIASAHICKQYISTFPTNRLIHTLWFYTVLLPRTIAVQLLGSSHIQQSS